MLDIDDLFLLSFQIYIRNLSVDLSMVCEGKTIKLKGGEPDKDYSWIVQPDNMKIHVVKRKS